MNRQKMSIKKALQMMDDFIDPSDPDLDVENSIHAYQTAERIKEKYPNITQEVGHLAFPDLVLKPAPIKELVRDNKGRFAKKTKTKKKEAKKTKGLEKFME